MSKINETLVMMAEHAEVFKIGDRNFQIIEVKEAEQQPDYSHLVGKFVRCIFQDTVRGFTKDKWYPVEKLADDGEPLFLDDDGSSNGFFKNDTKEMFDLSNPYDTNPDEKTVWEKANEAMWEYNTVKMDVMFSSGSKAHNKASEHLDKEWKHIRAYLFLSKFADLCNEGRKVYFENRDQEKFVISCSEKELYCQSFAVDKRHIAFLDEEARDYSLKVHEQIWKDYWGIE